MVRIHLETRRSLLLRTFNFRSHSLGRVLSRLIVGLVQVTVLAVVLAACGPADEPSNEAALGVGGSEGTAQIAGETSAVATGEPSRAEFDTIEDAMAVAGETIRVAVNAQFRPFVYIDESGTFAGFDIELMDALAEAGEFTVEYADLPFEQLLTATARGEYDVALSAITVTDERMRIVDFTQAYFDTGQAVVPFLDTGQGLAVRALEAQIFTVDDLTPATRVGVKENTTGDDYASSELRVDVIRYDEIKPLLAALEAGEVDAVVVDVSVITRAIEETESAEIRLTQTDLTDEAYAIAVNKDRSDLLGALNAGLDELRTRGTYDELFARYFAIP